MFSRGRVANFQEIARCEKPPEKHLQKNLAIEEREARENRELASITSEGESSERSKNGQRPSGRTTNRSKARVPRISPGPKQQARTIAASLARALRALAGGFSWERLRDGHPVENLLEIPREY